MRWVRRRAQLAPRKKVLEVDVHAHAHTRTHNLTMENQDVQEEIVAAFAAGPHAYIRLQFLATFYNAGLDLCGILGRACASGDYGSCAWAMDRLQHKSVDIVRVFYVATYRALPGASGRVLPWILGNLKPLVSPSRFLAAMPGVAQDSDTTASGFPGLLQGLFADPYVRGCYDGMDPLARCKFGWAMWQNALRNARGGLDMYVWILDTWRPKGSIWITGADLGLVCCHGRVDLAQFLCKDTPLTLTLADWAALMKKTVMATPLHCQRMAVQYLEVAKWVVDSSGERTGFWRFVRPAAFMDLMWHACRVSEEFGKWVLDLFPYYTHVAASHILETLKSGDSVVDIIGLLRMVQLVYGFKWADLSHVDRENLLARLHCCGRRSLPVEDLVLEHLTALKDRDRDTFILQDCVRFAYSKRVLQHFQGQGPRVRAVFDSLAKELAKTLAHQGVDSCAADSLQWLALQGVDVAAFARTVAVQPFVGMNALRWVKEWCRDDLEAVEGACSLRVRTMLQGERWYGAGHGARHIWAAAVARVWIKRVVPTLDVGHSPNKKFAGKQ